MTWEVRYVLKSCQQGRRIRHIAQLLHMPFTEIYRIINKRRKSKKKLPTAGRICNKIFNCIVLIMRLIGHSDLRMNCLNNNN
jgi:hypothetical protein